MVRLLSHAFTRRVRAGQVADQPASHAEPGPALRRPRLADPRALEPVLRRSRTRIRWTRTTSSPAPGSRTAWPGVGHSRRLRHVLREAVDRPLRELLAEPRLHQLVPGAVPGRRRPIPGPSRTVPDRSAARQRADAEPDARRTSSCRRARWPGTPARCGSTRRIGSFRCSSRRRSATSGRSAGSCRSPPITCTFRTGIMPLRYNLNPGDQADDRPHGADHARGFPRASRISWGSRPFSSDVFIVEYIGETKYDGLNLAIEKRFADYWGAPGLVRAGQGLGQHQRLRPTATNDFQVLDRAQSGSERRADQRRPPARGDAQRPVRGAVDPGPDRRRRRAVHDQRTPFTIHNSNVDANRNNIAVDPIAGGHLQRQRARTRSRSRTRAAETAPTGPG